MSNIMTSTSSTGSRLSYFLSGLESCERTIYLIPRAECDACARSDKPTSKTAHLRYYRIDEVERLFAGFRSNFTLAT